MYVCMCVCVHVCVRCDYAEDDLSQTVLAPLGLVKTFEALQATGSICMCSQGMAVTGQYSQGTKKNITHTKLTLSLATIGYHIQQGPYACAVKEWLSQNNAHDAHNKHHAHKTDTIIE